LGRDLRHLINVVHDLSTRSIGFKVLTGHGASIDTTTPAGKLVFGIFAALADAKAVRPSRRAAGTPAWNCGIYHTATGAEPPGGVDLDELLKYATTEPG
jgi:hypothetical protein